MSTMEYHDTPPCSNPDTPDATTSNVDATEVSLATPTSISATSLELTSEAHKFHIPATLTQAAVDADPQLKRFQQDLLMLTSINENEIIHWRPSWFNQEPFSKKFWTLQNPPSVVTERIPHKYKGRQYYTRRTRQAEDPPPLFIKTWDHWRTYCDMYGLPYEFLSEGQIELMRLGLPRDEQGNICGKSSSIFLCMTSLA